MSTFTPNPTLELPGDAAPDANVPANPPRPLSHKPGMLLPPAEPVYGGLTLSAWVKVGTVAALMAVLFRFNLARLWLKTNPFYGQANWSHAVAVPLIGLYYLYVHRREMTSPPSKAPWSARMAAFTGCATVCATLWGACGFLYLLLPNLGRAVLLPAALASVILPVAAALLPLFTPGARRAGRDGRRGFAVVPIQSDSGANAQPPSADTSGDPSDTSVDPSPAAGWLAPVAARSSTWFGAFVMAWGILFSFYGIWPGQNDFFKDFGMVVALFGVVLLLGGWHVMRVAWFPVVFLLCALPWPDQVYSWVAGPLQRLAAWVAVRILRTFCGVEAYDVGTKILMSGQGGVIRTLNVAEACAGLRSLMTFISVAAAWAFLFLSSRPLWQKLVVSASAVPIAIFCNVMRVTGQGILDHYWTQQWSEGFAHQFAGMAMLIPAFFLILLVGWVLDNVFIEVADAPAGTTPAKKPGAAGAKAAKVVRVTKPAGARVVQIPRPAAKLLPDVRADGVALALPAPAAPRGREAVVVTRAAPALEAQEAAVAAPPAQAPRPAAKGAPARPAGGAALPGRPPAAKPAAGKPAMPTAAKPVAPVAAKPAARPAAKPVGGVAAPANSTGNEGMAGDAPSPARPMPAAQKPPAAAPPTPRPKPAGSPATKPQAARTRPVVPGTGTAQPPKKPATQAPQTTQINAAPTEEGL